MEEFYGDADHIEVADRSRIFRLPHDNWYFSFHIASSVY
jgi:hypothetical protein